MQSSAAPTSAPRWRTFDSQAGSHLLVVENSQVFDISRELKRALDDGEAGAERALRPILDRGLAHPLDVPTPVAPQSISLNVSSSCNLACSYCYAGRGGFGGTQSGALTWAIARAAIDKLLATSERNAPAVVGFLGGEPFVNRRLIHRATRYAAARGRGLGQEVCFSVTTNGSLLRGEDIELMRSHPYAVTVSIDGDRAVHEKQRPGADFDELIRTLEPLLANPGLATVTARATIMRDDLDLTERYDAIRAVGFREIGFSPVRVGPQGDALRDEDWADCLDAYRVLGTREMMRLQQGGRTGFSNLVVALKQIHRGACSPYPCGAGGGYFSVAANGTWYACHRAIGDEAYEMGDNSGLDAKKRSSFLEERHVHSQTDCRLCWARYLCSGSCHQEAKVRSVSSCDFIREWLQFCLQAYVTLGEARVKALFGRMG